MNSTQNLFVLEVPRHFVVPNTQQWNLTVQRELGRHWVLEVGYVGTRGIHLRETRDAIQSVDASKTPFTVTDASGNSYTITTNTFANAIARTPAPGLNGYSGYQLFANDAYSIYNALQTTVSRRWAANYFQAAYTFSKNIDATSTGNTAFNTAYNDQSNINASRGHLRLQPPAPARAQLRLRSAFLRARHRSEEGRVRWMAGQRGDDIPDGPSVLDLRFERGHGLSGTRQHAAAGRKPGSGSEHRQRALERRYSFAAGQWVSERVGVHAGAATVSHAVRFRYRISARPGSET